MYPATFAASAPDRPAVVMGGSGTVVTYRELEARSNQFAHHLRGLDLGPDDVVAVLMDNNPRYHEVAWAVRRIGRYFTPVNTHLTADEVAYIVNDSRATVLIANEALREVAASLTSAVVPNVRHRLFIGPGLAGWADYDDVVRGQPCTPVRGESEGDIIQYSSGTTGKPKGIRRPLTGAPITLDQDPVVPFLRAMGVTEQSTYLSPAPLYHAAPIHWTMAVHRLGGTVVVMERFDPAECLALIERYHVTHAQFVPTMFVRMLKLPEEERSTWDVSSLEAVVHAAAPCPVDVKQAMIDWWGPIISEYYSATEGIGATFITAPDWLAHRGSVGTAMMGVAHILDDAGNELPPGEVGAVWFSGGVEFNYHNDPQKTAEAKDARGYSTVGDVGYLDEEGYLYLTDRKAFMIISGGVNIYPQEAENVLINHPKVLDVGVIGVPDAEMGEAVKAIVQPAHWDDAGPELEAELIAYCREHLASFKCPRSVDFDKELPRLDTGKLYKKQLRARYWPAP
jgi:long-chain acyl-CoA synthetase